MAKTCLYVFFIFIICIQAISNEIKCPVSTLICTSNATKSGYHFYPLEYYDVRQKAHFSGSRRRHAVNTYGSTVFNCTAKGVYYNERWLLRTQGPKSMLNLTCGFIPCPITNRDVKLFHGGNRGSTRSNYEWDMLKEKNVNKLPTDIQHSLCHLAPLFRTPHTTIVNTTINVIVLGGSVAAGYETIGCKLYGKTKNRDCCFGGFVYRWLKLKLESSSVKVNYYPLAVGGYTTETASDNLARRMAEFKLKAFTKNDILMIDHSLNDLFIFQKWASPKILERSLELLIRKILQLSEGIGPTIYLMHTAASMSIDSIKTLKTVILPRNYTVIPQVYTAISSYYRFRILSYFDLIWNPLALTSPLLLAMRVMGNDLHKHPPWHMHLFWADLIARSIEIDVEECSRLDLHTERSLDSIGKLVLPSLLHDTSDSAFRPQEAICMNHSESYINVDSRIVNKLIRKNETSFHRWNTTTWKFMEDRRDKPGWISKFKVNLNSDIELNRTHALSFQLYPFQRSEYKHTEMDMGIHVYYLRSYEHAGIVEVHLCGQQIGAVDVLSADYAHFRVSMPVLKTIKIPSDLPCFEHLFGIVPPIYNEGYKLEFIHKWQRSGKKSKRSAQRKSQKVKLLSIQLCRIT